MDSNALIAAGFVAILLVILVWLVVSPAIKEGLIIKTGLIVSVMGLLALALWLPSLQPCSDGGMHPIVRAVLIVGCGAMITVAGVIIKASHERPFRRWLRNSTGWPPLSDDSLLDESDARHN